MPKTAVNEPCHLVGDEMYDENDVELVWGGIDGVVAEQIVVALGFVVVGQWPVGLHGTLKMMFLVDLECMSGRWQDEPGQTKQRMKKMDETVTEK